MAIAFNKLIPELCVKNLEKSLAFYGRLGFLVLYRRESERFVFLQRDDAQIMLEELSDNSWITGEMEFPLGRGINLQIQVADVDFLYDLSVQHGFHIYKAIYEKWYRVENYLQGNKQFLIQDPDGCLLRFFQDLGSAQI